jgi:hypothetical protein
MSRRDLVRDLVRSMPDRENAVAYPDHPHLMRGPDVLARVDDRLVAYFLFADGGFKPGSPAGRALTLLSRLALPEGTAFVLVDYSTHGLRSDHDLDLFDGVQFNPPSERKNLGGPWEDVGNDVPATLVRKLRPFHSRRFADAWATRDSFLPRRIQPGIPTPQLRGPKIQRLPRGVDEQDGQLYAPLDQARDRSELARRFSRLVTTAVEYDYSTSLDSLEATVGALISRDAYLPLHQATAPMRTANRVSDTLKPYRAAAFAGFHTTIVGD